MYIWMLKVWETISQYSHGREQRAQKKKKNMKKETKRKMEENEFWDNRVIFGGGKRDEKFNQTFYIQHFY